MSQQSRILLASCDAARTCRVTPCVDLVFRPKIGSDMHEGAPFICMR